MTDRRKRALLADFYGKSQADAKASSAADATNIDGAHFDADVVRKARRLYAFRLSL
jgi:hypothetical protein